MTGECFRTFSYPSDNNNYNNNVDILRLMAGKIVGNVLSQECFNNL